MTALDRLEALLAAHDGNPMAFVGELNVLANAALPALVRVANAAQRWCEGPDLFAESAAFDEMVLALRALERATEKA